MSFCPPNTFRGKRARNSFGDCGHSAICIFPISELAEYPLPLEDCRINVDLVVGMEAIIYQHYFVESDISGVPNKSGRQKHHRNPCPGCARQLSIQSHSIKVIFNTQDIVLSEIAAGLNRHSRRAGRFYALSPRPPAQATGPTVLRRSNIKP